MQLLCGHGGLKPREYGMDREGIQRRLNRLLDQYEALELAQNILMPYYLAGDWMLGLLAHTMGNLDRAISHFEDGLAFCSQADYRPQLAWTCCDYADNNPGDRDKAMLLPLLERVLSRRIF